MPRMGKAARKVSVGIRAPGLGTTREGKNRDPTEDMFGVSPLGLQLGTLLAGAQWRLAGSFATESPSG